MIASPDFPLADADDAGTGPDVEADALRDLFAAGGVLTAHQASKLIGVPFSTFNYHMHLGHIYAIPDPVGRTYYVRRVDAERFGRRLRLYRNRYDNFDWQGDDTDAENSANGAVSS